MAEHRAKFLALVPLSLTGFLLARNWMGWMDPLTDFGRELYIPWRLSQGQVLYRDIAYLDGPLAPHWNALLFTLFPVSIRTLEFANLGVILAVCVLIFSLMRRSMRTGSTTPSDTRVAIAGVTIFLGIFAFNLDGRGGNMNWVSPYSHGITHGVALALFAFWWFARFIETGTRANLLGTGLTLGLVALTKPEVFLGAGLAVGVGFAALLWSSPPGADPPARRAALLLGAAAVPFVISVALLAQAMPLPDAMAGTLGGWAHVAGSEVSRLFFYRWVMGIDEPVENLLRIGLALSIWASVLVPAWALSFARLSRGLDVGPSIAIPVAVVGVAAWVGDRYAWGEIFLPLPIFLVGFASAALVRVWRLRTSRTPQAILLLTLSVGGLVLLLKVLLKPYLSGYAFALAPLGAMLVVLTLLHFAPSYIARRGGDPRIFRRASIALLAAIMIGCLQANEFNRTDKTVTVWDGGDRFIGRPDRLTGAIGNLAMWVDETLSPVSTLLPMPEGALVNYLARRINPTPHLNFLPPELAIFGEEQILADLRANPPDYIALIHRDTLEYGLPLFGIDYGERLLLWVREDYELVKRVGRPVLQPERLEDAQGRWEILERKQGEFPRVSNRRTKP